MKTPADLLDECTSYLVTLTYMETKCRFTPMVIEQIRAKLAMYAAETKAAIDGVELVTLPDPEKWRHIRDARKTAPEMPRVRRDERERNR